jgi:hypothetical protein
MKMGAPRDATGVPGRTVTLGFQTTVGRRFERLRRERIGADLESVFEAKS